MQEPDRSWRQIEHVDRIDNIASVAQQDIAKAVGSQIPGAERFCQNRQCAQRKERVEIICVRMAASPGEYMSVNTNSPLCTSNVSARMIGTYEKRLSAEVRNRNKLIFFCGDIVVSLILHFDE